MTCQTPDNGSIPYRSGVDLLGMKLLGETPIELKLAHTARGKSSQESAK
jgi:hypothetical protein